MLLRACRVAEMPRRFRSSFLVAIARRGLSSYVPIHASYSEYENQVQRTLSLPSPYKNLPPTVAAKVGRRLHRQQGHPLHIIKSKIEQYFRKISIQNKWDDECVCYDDLHPVVDPKSCFDDLRVTSDHVSRRPSDTYYLTEELLMRTHTSAHQNHFISRGKKAFVVSGDVYRRDEIDASHYPVFHQMEGVRIWDDLDISEETISVDLQRTLSGLAIELFGDSVEMRWNSDHFPFTEPSFELEVKFEGKWLEVLGCGVVHQEVMSMASRPNSRGWAFGLGLERLAMVLFGINDIRLFWSEDERFHAQFRDIDLNINKLPKFKPYSKYPECWKDVSFWLPPEGFHHHDVYEVIRTIGGDLVEKVALFDEFENKKTGRTSHAYRISYRHMDRSLTNEEVDELQLQVRSALEKELNVELR